MDSTKDGWRHFLTICHDLKTTEQFDDFFDVILTMGEKEDISHRVEILSSLLKKETKQRELASNLHVSIAKITRGSNQLKRMDEATKKLFLAP